MTHFKPRLWQRFALSFLLLIALLIVVGAYGAYGASRLARDMEQTATSGMSQIRRAQTLQLGVATISTASRDLLLLDEAKQLRRQQGLIDQALKSAVETETELREMPASDEEKKVLQSVFETKEKFTASVAKFRNVHRDGTIDDARQVLVMDMRPAQAAYQGALERLVQLETQEAAQRASDGTSLARTTVLVTMALVAVAAVLGSIAALVIARSILKPVAQAKAAVEAIAAGDLATPVQSESNDEIGEMLHRLEQMRVALAAVVSKVSQAAARVDQSSGAISDGNEALADRTSRAGGSLQQTAASVEQIATTLKGTTQLTVEAAGMAEGARLAASAGGEAVHTVISTMQSIASSSARIGDIIAVIDGIAFQTNILALNAAVEAARAGEQGRGFAVVASEVRALAGRSANAAREVRQLIQASSEHVEAGNSFVNDAGKKIDNVIAKVNAVSELLERISQASGEQSKGVEQVSGAMYEVDQSTRQNGTLVIRLGESVETLKDSARALSASVAFFQTDCVEAV